MQKGAQDEVCSWWQRNQDPSLDPEPRLIPEKRLLYALLHRALSDLDLNVYIDPEDRRDAIKWFRGSSRDKSGLTFIFVKEELHLRDKVLKIIEGKVNAADCFSYKGSQCSQVPILVTQMAV